MGLTSDTVDDYIIVVEYRGGGPTSSVGYDAVEAIVEELREWHPAALFSPERYALQIHVPAHGPTDALRRGVALHDRAVRALGMPVPVLVRVEVLTGGEFESQMKDADGSRIRPASHGSVLTNELYWATRALLRAASASELSDVLVTFVTSVGAQVDGECPEESDHQIVLDLSLQVDESLFAIAERVSVPGMILASSLPMLVADARVVLGRRKQWLSGSNERALPGVNQWCSPDDEG